ncbi:MAG: hypothetical protein ACOZF0_06500 [Thermodesulfobacteriota bacterium]
MFIADILECLAPDRSKSAIGLKSKIELDENPFAEKTIIMLENMLPVAKQFHDVMTHVLGPFINGESSHHPHLFLPSDLYHIISCCDSRTEFFKYERAAHECAEGRNPVMQNGQNHLPKGKTRPVSVSDPKSRVPKIIHQRCRIGIRKTVAQFPAFENATSCHGLPIGKKEGIYWIKPFQVELMKTGISDGIFPLEIRSVFLLTFESGTTGKAGYIDRMNSPEKLRRFHLYQDGKQETADAYSEQRRMHDLFRTLMGQILLAEIHPSLYRIFRPYIRPCLPGMNKKESSSPRLASATSDSHNILPFITNRVRRVGKPFTGDLPKQFRSR